MTVSVSLAACLTVAAAAGFGADACLLAETDLPSELPAGVCDGAAFEAAVAAGVEAACDCSSAGFCSGCLGENFDMNCWLMMMATKVSAKTSSSRRKSFGS